MMLYNAVLEMEKSTRADMKFFNLCFGGKKKLCVMKRRKVEGWRRSIYASKGYG
jgi:hypothetical protein